MSKNGVTLKACKIPLDPTGPQIYLTGEDGAVQYRTGFAVSRAVRLALPKSPQPKKREAKPRAET